MIKFLKSVMISNLDDELVLMDTKNGHYYSLNESASEIINYLQDGKTVEEVANLLNKKYSINIESVTNDINELIINLKNKKLID